MYFYCKCGYRISDTTDYIRYKGYIIADQDWFDFWDRIEMAVKSDSEDKEKLFDDLFFDDIESLIYQCPNCGNLYLNGKENKLIGFMAPENTDTHMLESHSGDKWKGFLYAYWDEILPPWSKHRGSIYVEVNGKYNNTYFFDEYDELEKKYYKLFYELKDTCLRSSHLKKNDIRIHDWSL